MNPNASTAFVVTSPVDALCSFATGLYSYVRTDGPVVKEWLRSCPTVSLPFVYVVRRRACPKIAV